MNQAIYAIFNFDEGAKVRQVSHPSVDPTANLVTLIQSLPGIILNLLHAQTDAARFWIDAQNFNFDVISGIDDLAGMLDPL